MSPGAVGELTVGTAGGATREVGRRVAPIGACTEAVKSSKISRSIALETLLVISANGNECSSNTTCLEIITLLDRGSKHRYPWKKMHMVERGANLWDVVAERFG